MSRYGYTRSEFNLTPIEIKKENKEIFKHVEESHEVADTLPSLKFSTKQGSGRQVVKNQEMVADESDEESKTAPDPTERLKKKILKQKPSKNTLKKTKQTLNNKTLVELKAMLDLQKKGKLKLRDVK